MATTVSDRSTTTEPGPAPPGSDRTGGRWRWPSLREMFTIHRDGPVTGKERRRSAIGAVVAVVALGIAVGVLHLVDGSGEFDPVMLGIVAVVLAVVGYAFPRFTTTPGLAMMSRHPDRNSTSSKIALVVFGLLLFAVAVVKIYY
jgi:hypothetical protein